MARRRAEVMGFGQALEFFEPGMDRSGRFR
jgi:hypothetical protein